MSKSQPKPETRAPALKEALMKRVYRRIVGNGSVLLPAAPALLDSYVEMLSVQFRTLGRPFSPEELAHLRKLLSEKLDEGFKASPYSRINIDYRTDTPPAVTLSYTISIRHSTMEDEYAEWTRTRPPPFFGTHPDAKVMAVAASLGRPEEVPIVDIGAGTGRNTLPLARAGYPTAAVEASPALYEILKKSVADEGLSVEVFGGNALDASIPLAKNHYKLIILCEVVYHLRELHQLRTLFRRCAELLAPGGVLCFSAFLSHDSYTPDRLVRELGEVFWSHSVSRKELATSMAELPFSPIADESVYEYEKEHLPKEAWPPTGWFAEWTRGLDVFALPDGKSPIELRWLTFRREA